MPCQAECAHGYEVKLLIVPGNLRHFDRLWKSDEYLNELLYFEALMRNFRPIVNTVHASCDLGSGD
jgi:hypothetical protein